jgi:hypothetical protein
MHSSNLMLFIIQVTITCFLVASCTETSVTEISSASGCRLSAPEAALRTCESCIHEGSALYEHDSRLGPVLRRDVNLSKCRGFLIDGDHSIEWRKAPRTPSLERSVRYKQYCFPFSALYSVRVLQGTLPFMALRLLYAWETDKPIVHTAVDDLESFLWVLVWALVHILKEFGTTRNLDIETLEETFSSHSIRSIMRRGLLVQQGWEDVVFGGLILEWLSISQKANLAIKQLLGTISGSGNDKDVQQVGFDRLEEYCRTVYMEYIQAGQKHLESIRQHPDWKAVVKVNPGWL